MKLETRIPKKHTEEILHTKFNWKLGIFAAHRIMARGQHQSPQATEFKLLVILNSVWEVRTIYSDRTRALQNYQKYVSSEDLTREEAHLYFLARKLKKRRYMDRRGQRIRNKRDFLKLLLQDDPILLKLENTGIRYIITSPTSIRRPTIIYKWFHHEHQNNKACITNWEQCPKENHQTHKTRFSRSWQILRKCTSITTLHIKITTCN